MKNAMQLKSIMKNMAKDKGISAQLMLQNYMMERLLKRVSLSEYKENFIIKGGFLIASIVGLDTRATMDIDATIKGYPVNETTIQKMFEKICEISIDDDINFSFENIGEIREGDNYIGYRVSVSANYPPMSVPLKLDITTGDVITPREIEFKYKTMMDDEYISVLAYNLETVLSEKLEAVISRGDQSTRPRDYYDIYVLWKLKQDEINIERLCNALQATSLKRGSEAILERNKEIMKIVKNSPEMHDHWSKYQRNYSYAKDVDFNKTCDTIVEIMEIIKNH